MNPLTSIKVQTGLMFAKYSPCACAASRQVEMSVSIMRVRTTFSSWPLASSAAIPLPPGFDHALAVAMLVQGVTAYILLDEAKAKEGDIVLVSAAGGGLGNLAVQLAKARGAKVVGLTSKLKLDLVRSLGADHAVDSDDADWALSVKKAVGEKGIQVYLDSIGDLRTEAFPPAEPIRSVDHLWCSLR